MRRDAQEIRLAGRQSRQAAAEHRGPLRVIEPAEVQSTCGVTRRSIWAFARTLVRADGDVAGHGQIKRIASVRISMVFDVVDRSIRPRASTTFHAFQDGVPPMPVAVRHAIRSLVASVTI